MLAVPVTVSVVTAPEAQAAACYGTSTYVSPFKAEASVSYHCSVGSTRSVAHVNNTGDSGWHEAATSAWAAGVNMIPGGPYAYTQVTGNIR